MFFQRVHFEGLSSIHSIDYFFRSLSLVFRFRISFVHPKYASVLQSYEGMLKDGGSFDSVFKTKRDTQVFLIITYKTKTK